MRILFVSSKPPYPTHNGSSLRIFHLIRELAANGHEVTLYSLCEPGMDPASLGPLHDMCSGVRLFPWRADRWRNAWRAYWEDLPYALLNYDALELRQALDSVADHMDIVHMNSLHMAQFAREGWPSVFDSHNVDHVLWERQAALTWNPPRRIFCRRQAALLRPYEQTVVSRCALTLACSEKDAGMLGPGAVVIPNGVDCRIIPSPHPEPGHFMFIGEMSWAPNVDAVRWFRSHIFPRIQSRIPDARFTIVGHSPSRSVRALASREVAVTGRVPSVAPYHERADVLVVPLRCGSGTRLKILEAMAAGVPVVSTAIGCEGLECEPGSHLLQGETAQDFAEACIRLSEDRRLHGEIALRARHFVEARYDWRDITARLEAAYARVME